MEYRRLGRTQEKISTIGMGTWRIGKYSTLGERESQVNAIRRGIELGINLIDTAEMYSGGKSEEVVGEAIREAREKAFVATKVSPENLRHDAVIKSCRGSLKRLNTSHIDLYQIHWPNPDVPIIETMKAMEELVRSGMVNYVGVSNFSVEQTRDAAESLSTCELASNQVEYSFANRSVEADILPYCEREKLTLIAYSPLARGRVPGTLHGEVQRRYGLTPAQVALNWVTRSPSVVAIPKAVDAHHLEENAASVTSRFSEDEYAAISGIRLPL